MENKTDVKKVEAKKVEAKPKAECIADAVKLLGKADNKSRKDLATKVVSRFTGRGITKNSKGKTISVEAVTAQIGAIVRCIEKHEGPKAWENYKVVEEEADEEKHKTGVFKIVLKA